MGTLLRGVRDVERNPSRDPPEQASIPSKSFSMRICSSAIFDRYV